MFEKIKIVQMDKKEEYCECPICGKKSFKYSPKIDANQCHDEFCGWNDRVGPVLEPHALKYLDFCLSNAKSDYHKQYISRVIDVTKKLEENANRLALTD